MLRASTLRRSRAVRSRRSFATTLACLLLTACQGPKVEAPPRPEDARQALTDFLEAWKAGRPEQRLVDRQPPVEGREPEWANGTKLIDYVIDDSGDPFGNSLHLRTSLTIQRPDSKRTENLRVLYIVTTGRPLSIVRE